LHQLSPSLTKIWRYYKVGLVNTVFGYALYALFLKAGCGLYLAQIISHLMGMAFNYFSYSRHVFTDAKPSKTRFILSYALNYLIGLASLASAAGVIPSPYIAGLVAILITSAINFLILNRFVFKPLTA